MAATGDGKPYLAAVEDLFSRRLLGFAMNDRHEGELAVASLRMAAAVRGGSVAGIMPLPRVIQSMGRVGSALDNAAAESFFSTLEHELLSRRQFATRDEARHVVAGWIDRFYNRIRRHSATGIRSPIDYELATAAGATAARSVAKARYLLRPPLAATSRDTVDGARPSTAAMLRNDSPAARPREISSRSANDNRSSHRPRGAGRMPPLRLSRSRTVDGCRRISRASTFTACPDRHRRQTSATSAGDNADRTIDHHPIPPPEDEDHEVLR